MDRHLRRLVLWGWKKNCKPFRSFIGINAHLAPLSAAITPSALPTRLHTASGIGQRQNEPSSLPFRRRSCETQANESPEARQRRRRIKSAGGKRIRRSRGNRGNPTRSRHSHAHEETLAGRASRMGTEEWDPQPPIPLSRRRLGRS